jgi:hypothetical protein
MSSSLPAGPTPLQSFLGGVGLALPAQALLSFNHSMFGISGFIHRAVRGNLDDFTSLLGLISGGFAIAFIEGGSKPLVQNSPPLHLVLSGLLVGMGSKVCSESIPHFKVRNVYGNLPNSIAPGYLRPDEQWLHIRVHTILLLMMDIYLHTLFTLFLDI